MKPTRSLSNSYRFAAIIVAIIGPLTASALMAASFLSDLGTGADSYILLLASVVLLASATILGSLAGKCIRAGNGLVAGVCGVTWACILVFSTSTSSLSLLDSSGATINRQIAESGKYQSVQASVDANIAAMAGLQAQINEAPSNWRTRKAEWAGQIQTLQQQNATLFRMQSSMQTRGEGSSVQQAFAKLESVGLSRTALIVLFAICLDLTQFSASLALGYLSGNRRREKGEMPKQTKKSKPNLRAVS